MASETQDYEQFIETLQLAEETLKQQPDQTIVPPSAQERPLTKEMVSTLPVMEIDETNQESVAPVSADLKIEGTIGEGGMGVVQLARQKSLDRLVAVKTTRGGGEQAMLSLLQEAYVTGVMEHPNVVPVHALGRLNNGAPLIVMKRIEGVNWQDVIDDPRLAPDTERADQVWHIRVLLQVMNALRFAHSRGIVHRDIKPENVMLGGFGEVYLLDWGIALTLKDESDAHAMAPSKSRSKGIAGTPAYMAPEMTLDDATQIDERTDVYLLGAVLHQIITGEHRHLGSNLFEILHSAHTSAAFEYLASVPEELANIANRSMAVSKDDRFQSVTEFHDALQNYLEHRDSLALASAAEERLQRFQDLMRRKGEEDTADIQIIDVSTEARFGFRQALDMWDGNVRAREGLQTCLELMIADAIQNGNDMVASALIKELPEPNPELQTQVDELQARRDAERAEMERLRQLQRDLDMSVGARYRSWMMFGLGFLWSASTWFAGYDQLEKPLTDPSLLEAHVFSTPKVVGIAAVLIFVFRKALFANAIGRRVTFALMLSLGALVAMRGYAWMTKMSVVDAQSAEFFAFGLTAAFVGLFTDARISILGVLVFWGGAFASVINPAYQVFVLAGATFVFFTGLAWFWAPGQLEKKVELIK